MLKRLALTLCMLAPLGAPVSAQQDLLKKEQGVFEMFCAHCHGKNMVNPGNSSFDLRKFPKDDPQRFFRSVTMGRGDMPAWGDVLLPEEMDLLWHYVSSRAGKESTPFEAGIMTAENMAPKPDRADTQEPSVVLPERVAAGNAIYDRLCFRCHGQDMVSPGTAAFDLRTFPRDDPERFRDSVTKGHVDMPAWGDLLGPGDIDLLWDYVRTGGGKDQAALAPLPGRLAGGQETDDLGASDSAPDPFEPITPGTLTACLARNGGVMSSRRSRGGAGLDYELVAALAERLGLKLDVAWFESEQEEESTPVREAYAMLAYGVCDIYPGFALYASSLGGFYKTRAALPRWDDRPQYLGRGFQVDLQPISVSQPYARMEIGVVYRNASFDRDIKKVADMDGLRIGVQEGTLAGVLTLRQGTQRMVDDAKLYNPGPDFLWKMEQGEFDAAMVTIGAYDFQHKQNPVSTLVLDDYRHPIGFNLGVAVLQRNRALLDRIDPEIHAMLADGTLADLARKSRVTWSPPREPWVENRLTMRDILTRR